MESKSKSRLRTVFEVLTFIIAVATAGFYISDTMTGTPVFAKALTVVGFCPATTATIVGPTGATGETGTIGATGPAGACQAPMNLSALAANLVPSKDNTFSLGTSKLRWKDIQVGPGTIYLQDKDTGQQVGLTVATGTLLLDGVENLRLGNIRITKDGIESLIAGQDIRIGNITDRGYLSVANGVKFPDGTVFTSAPRNGIDGATGPAGSIGPAGASGSAGAQGIQGVQGVQGPAGNSFTLKGHYANLAAFNAGAGAAPGAIGDAWLLDSDGSIMVYAVTGWFDAGDLMGPQGVQGPQGPTGAQGPKGDTGAQGPAGTIAPYGKQYVCVKTVGLVKSMYWGTCASQGLTGNTAEYWILATFPF
jgi:collagen type II alpha